VAPAGVPRGRRRRICEAVEKAFGEEEKEV